ncbi:hypothetical protein CRENPOLYSF2_1870012 [Crenothrix polyspora]|uniref:Uncharacterized protein n=1 Tax=Crenothrix polyspora TaxID=360316 RepID=A0A1R4H4T0_9GAMM|nr:hypothetical protein CRENPOLYSF2_1870012 [Crenothrix polyspora]
MPKLLQGCNWLAVNQTLQLSKIYWSHGHYRFLKNHRVIQLPG